MSIDVSKKTDMGAKSSRQGLTGQRDFLMGMGIWMKEISYWDQFMQSGKVEDYLKFKSETKEEKNPKGDTAGAGFYDRNRNDNQGSAYR